MVNWFHPTELVRAGTKAFLSKLFGAYADNREIQALRSGGGATADYSDVTGPGEALWFDYVADLGDGFNATYAIARLLGAEKLPVSYAGGGPKEETSRGRFLIMGGDQVYPTATQEEYQQRLTGPYRAALPYVASDDHPPHLYAIPGNHDWYDGLTSFTRLFCQKRWIGGWETHQSRSYFSIKLPHGWWVWGIDVQLDSDIDEPQMNYFGELADQMDEGSKIILCTAEPSWVYAATKGTKEYRTLSVFEDKVIRHHKHVHVVGLAGDLHAYARYRHEDGRQRFISGGGGAYLYPTHRLPKSLSIPTAKPTAQEASRNALVESFTLGAHGDSSSVPPAKGEESLFPAARDSFLQALKSIIFVRYNVAFSALLGAYYVLVAWLSESASRSIGDAGSFFGAASSSWSEMMEAMGGFLPHAPTVGVFMAVFAIGMMAFVDSESKPRKILFGASHAILHGLAFLVSVRVAVLFTQSMLVVLLAVFVLGTVLAGIVWGMYLLLSHLVSKDMHSNEVLACQRIEDYKHFLRLRVSEEGLTIYPIGIRRVPRKWRFVPNATNGAPWFNASDGSSISDLAELIEPPIHVPG